MGVRGGGDLASWRYDYGRLGPILSGIRRIENAQTIDWPVNGVDTWVTSLEQVNGKLQVGFSARTYSPNFAYFEWRIDGGIRNCSSDAKMMLRLSEGEQWLEIRVRLANQGQSPESKYTFSLKGSY